MNKLKIQLGVIGYLPFKIDQQAVISHSSQFFEVVGFDEYHINSSSDTINWGYSDEILNRELPNDYNADFFLGVTYVPLENNYYARRLNNNRVVLSFHELHQIITEHSLPLENLIYRVLYGYGLVYLAANREIPPIQQFLSFTHDDTRGCIFDMNGNKTDVVFSLDSPILCDQCTNNLRAHKVADNRISLVKKELTGIRKRRYYKLVDFVKRKPVLAIVISLVSGMLVGMIGQVLLEVFFGDGVI
jgi:hypothetical protein